MKRLILWVVFTVLLLPGVLFAARQDVPHDPGDNSIVWGTATTPGTTAYILQQMFIELYGQFPTKWASGTVYTADNNSVVHGGNIYVCTTGHTAGATTEPGTGASWETYWNYSGSAAAAAAVAAHIAGDPHPQYRLESESIDSAEVSVTDSGTYWDSVTVEAWTQEVGALWTILDSDFDGDLTDETWWSTILDAKYEEGDAASFASVTVDPSSSPANTFNDSDGAGSELADKFAASIEAGMTTTTEDAEVSDLDFYYQDVGTKTQAFGIDGSENHVSFNIPIVGRMNYGADITTATSVDTTSARNSVYHFTAAATATLDAAADAGYGAVVSFRVRDDSEAAVVDLDASEKINLDGTALAAGTAITATGAGSFVTLISTTDTDGSGTDGWEVWGNNGFESE